MLEENVRSRSNTGSHLNAMLREVAKRSNMGFQHDVGRKCLIVYRGVGTIYARAYILKSTTEDDKK